MISNFIQMIKISLGIDIPSSTTLSQLLQIEDIVYLLKVRDIKDIDMAALGEMKKEILLILNRNN